MTKDKRDCLRNRLYQTVCKCFNIFAFCTRSSAPCMMINSSYSSPLMIPTPAMRRRNVYLSNRLKLTFYSTSFTSLDRESLSDHSMLQIALVDSDLCTRKDDIMLRMVNNNDRTRQNKPLSSSLSSSSSSSSSPISNCQSSLTIRQCYSTSIISSIPTTSIAMLNSSTKTIEKSPSSTLLSSPPTASHFSYLIRPTTPCIFGRETYDDEQMNDDEFFLTAGGIVHSCPNIYELSNDHHRKLQSCDHLIFIDQQTTLVNNSHLNCYDTELHRYSILPRFQPMSSSVSTDSMNSELELYKERHAVGLCRQYHDDTSTYASFLPTTWKSDNYLFFMPFIHHQSSLFNSIDHGKRSRSHDISVEQTYAPIIA